ncbi:RING-H2 finger protein ATL39-like [Hibiscus syriacus]|uniref:RING-H2 finger protein ATL39-like n=1 Tax=Hibiscus syriacus TaxID=106335 RepID=UPI0019243CA6|nr:RING-H2 finger protein ATL39-like [Hibiscus syriacus]
MGRLIEFLLHIRTFLEDDNGGFQEDHSQDFQDFSVWPEFVFGSHRHRNNVARRLLEAGWLEQRGLETILDHAFSQSNLIIEYEKKKKSRYSKGFNNVIRIIFSVKKYLSREHDDELATAMAMELSMQEAPRFVPATEESIKALKKVKFVEGYGEGIECMICMEKLVQSKTEVVTCMPCSHLFHGDCIHKWLSTGHHCPLCRFSMPTDDGKH